MQPPQRILVCPLRFIGDLVLTFPLLRALKQTFPGLELTVLAPRQLVNLLEVCPFVDHVLIEPRGTLERFTTMQSGRFDTAILMRRSVSQAGLLRLAGIPLIIGYDEQRFPPPWGYRRRGWFLDEALPFPQVDTDIPQVKTYLRLAEPLGISDADESLALWTTPDDNESVLTLLTDFGLDSLNAPIAVFHATSASREKAMRQEQFFPALRELDKAEFSVIAVGLEGEYGEYEDLAAKSGVRILNACGKTTLRQTYRLLQHAQLLFSLDSAPIHLAAAAGTPGIIGVYGPTNERQWRPYPYQGAFTPIFNGQLTCRPCVPKQCEHNRCRTDLQPEAIADAVRQHLSQYGQSGMALI